MMAENRSVMSVISFLYSWSMIILVIFIIGPVPVLVSVMRTLPMMSVNPAIVMLDSMMTSITVINFFSVGLL